MKVKDAHNYLARYTGNDLYQQACRLYREESNSRIVLRAHGAKPPIGTVQSVVEEMKGWFRKVAKGLAWGSPKVPEDIIGWESSAIYVRYNIVDPQVENYRKRTRLETLRGSKLPLLEAMRPGDLDALSGMMIAQIQRDAREYLELEKKREELAKQLGMPICPYGVKERFCSRQKTYSVVQPFPTSVDDLVFVCTVDKCIKEPS